MKSLAETAQGLVRLFGRLQAAEEKLRAAKLGAAGADGKQLAELFSRLQAVELKCVESAMTPIEAKMGTLLDQLVVAEQVVGTLFIFITLANVSFLRTRKQMTRLHQLCQLLLQFLLLL
jgi:hypothetical protein